MSAGGATTVRERSIRQVASLIGAADPGAEAVAGPDVVVDSRLATPGAVFVALPGEHVDGHDFIAAAAAGGASATVCTRVTDAPIVHLVVPDALHASGHERVGQTGGGPGDVQAGGVHHRQGGQCVADVEVAQDAEGEPQLAGRGGGGHQTALLRVGAEADQPHVRVGGAAGGEQWRAHSSSVFTTQARARPSRNSLDLASK